jgi:hypothetical protein
MVIDNKYHHSVSHSPDEDTWRNRVMVTVIDNKYHLFIVNHHHSVSHFPDEDTWRGVKTLGLIIIDWLVKTRMN